MGVLITSIALLSVFPSQARTKIILDDPKSDAKLAPLAAELSTAALIHLEKKPSLQIIGRSELKVMVSHQKDLDDLQKCEGDQACLDKITQIVEAQKLITGHLGRWGKGYVLTLQVLDLATRALERSDACQAESVEALHSCVPDLMDRLLDLSNTQSSTTSFQLDGKAKAAVMDLDAYDARKELAANLTQLLSIELRKTDRLDVISRREVQAMLSFEVQKQTLACQEDFECLAEIGGALGADFLVMGGIGRLEETFVLHLKLIDAANSKVLSRVSETFRGPEPELSKVLRFAIRNLLGEPQTGEGRVEVDSGVSEVNIHIDGNKLDPTETLPAGKHALAVNAEGYAPLSRDFFIEDKNTTRLQIELIELSKPWYKRWYTWAIIGGIVAAGATTAGVVMGTRDNSGVLEGERVGF